MKRKKPQKKPKALPPHLIPGNPGNSGGKPGRSGRPPNRLRQLAAELNDKYRLLEIAARIAAGDIEETWLDHDGDTHSSPTKNADRINAIKLIVGYADSQDAFSACIEDIEGGRRVSIYLPDNGR